MRDLFRKTPTFVPIRATEIESLMEVREGRVPSRGLSAGAGRHVDKLALFQNQSHVKYQPSPVNMHVASPAN